MRVRLFVARQSWLFNALVNAAAQGLSFQWPKSVLAQSWEVTGFRTFDRRYCIFTLTRVSV